MIEDTREPPEWTADEERARERAIEKAERAFARGDFDCVDWLVEHSDIGDELPALVLHLLRGPNEPAPRGWGTDAIAAGKALRQRLFNKWTDHAEYEALERAKDDARARRYGLRLDPDE